MKNSKAKFKDPDPTSDKEMKAEMEKRRKKLNLRKPTLLSSTISKVPIMVQNLIDYGESDPAKVSICIKKNFDNQLAAIEKGVEYKWIPRGISKSNAVRETADRYTNGDLSTVYKYTKRFNARHDYINLVYVSLYKQLLSEDLSDYDLKIRVDYLAKHIIYEHYEFNFVSNMVAADRNNLDPEILLASFHSEDLYLRLGRDLLKALLENPEIKEIS
jgi:hypothetical protein